MELDIWEANSAATMLASHPCKANGVYICREPECGWEKRYEAACDKDGCIFNPRRNGARKFYGRGSDFELDTTKPFTVVTQFISSDNTANGELTEIRRFYRQNGTIIYQPHVTVQGITHDNTISEEYCETQLSLFKGSLYPNRFKAMGGMKSTGEALKRGLVLVMSIWTQEGKNMAWLDSTWPLDSNPDFPGNVRGPCPPEGGRPEEIKANHLDTAVVFSNIRVGDIGSTT
jgi:cellulose 1,4-beta-cellobiosidase